MASKYDALKQHLLDADRGPLTMSFSEVEDVLGFPLPKSARAGDGWWLDRSSSAAHSHAFAWLAAGRRVGLVDRAAAQVTFDAVSPSGKVR